MNPSSCGFFVNIAIVFVFVSDNFLNMHCRITIDKFDIILDPLNEISYSFAFVQFGPEFAEAVLSNLRVPNLALEFASGLNLGVGSAKCKNELEDRSLINSPIWSLDLNGPLFVGLC